MPLPAQRRCLAYPETVRFHLYGPGRGQPAGVKVHMTRLREEAQGPQFRSHEKVARREMRRVQAWLSVFQEIAAR